MEDVVTSRRFMLEALCGAGVICLDGGKGGAYLIHPGASHDVEACSVVEDLLQEWMDKGLFEVCGTRKGQQDVCMQSADKSPSKPKPLVIHFTRDVTMHKPRGFQPIPVKKPAPFPYKSDKAVPWRYTPQRPDGIKDASVRGDQPTARVTKISGTSGVTHIKWIFAALELLIRSKDLKGKVKADVEGREKVSPILDDEVPAGRFAKEEEDFNKKGISTEEVTEFLRIIQQSEFKVIEQLNKTPTRISLRLIGNCWSRS